MSDGSLVTVVGSICREDPILKFTNNGLAIAEFTVRVPGSKAKNGKPAVEATFQDIVCWRELGENVAESLRQGDRVIVRGVQQTDTWTNKDGEEKTRTKVNAWNVGPDLSYATAEVTRVERKEAVAAAPAGGFGEF